MQVVCSCNKERVSTDAVEFLNIADFDAGKITGVSVDKRSTVRLWVARMRHNGKAKYLGCFATEEEAKAVYRAALVDLIECSRAS